MNRNFIAAGAVLVSTIFACSETSLAAPAWSGSQQYDNGLVPKIADAFGDIVEVHQGSPITVLHGSAQLWYRTGRAQGNSIAWGPSIAYDRGTTPAVTFGIIPPPPGVLIGTSFAIEAHAAHDDVAPLWYRTGKITSTHMVNWGPSRTYNIGVNPAITANGRTVVEVHQAGAATGPLWYRAGTLSTTGNVITWGASAQYDQGINPSIVFVEPSKVLEVHQATAGSGALWYRTGTISGNTITWAASHLYGQGANPGIANLSSSVGNHILEVHRGGTAQAPTLWYRRGRVVGSQIAWTASTQYDNGVFPAIGGNGCNAVEVHQAHLGLSPLWYRMFSDCPVIH
jgi:hypothetical protein